MKNKPVYITDAAFGNEYETILNDKHKAYPVGTVIRFKTGECVRRIHARQHAYWTRIK